MEYCERRLVKMVKQVMKEYYMEQVKAENGELAAEEALTPQRENKGRKL